MKFKELLNNSEQLSDEKILNSLGLKLEKSYTIIEEELSIIMKITKHDKHLEIHNDKYFSDHAKNGFLKLYKWNELKWFIFAHDLEVKWIKFYERGTLWIEENLRQHWLWRMLMNKMTKSLEWKNILSVTSNPTVQKVNEIIMDYEVTNPEWLIKQIIEIWWPLHNDYKYYINVKLKEILEK